MVLIWRQAGRAHFTSANWLAYGVAFFSVTLYILSLTPYIHQEQTESVLTKCEQREDYRALKVAAVNWVCRGGSMQLSPTHFESSSLLR